MDLITAHALVRFGLGRRSGEALPNDPIAWLLDQLKAGEAAGSPTERAIVTSAAVMSSTEAAPGANAVPSVSATASASVDPGIGVDRGMRVDRAMGVTRGIDTGGNGSSDTAATLNARAAPASGDAQSASGQSGAASIPSTDLPRGAGPAPRTGLTPTTAEGLAALRADRKNKPPPGESQSRMLFRSGAQAQLSNALTTATPFHERLVWFWSNHFTVSVRRPACAAVLPAFVAEAIRPNVTGRFSEMLLAVMRHPAMLLYLDNVASIGPGSPVGTRTHRGLNENLARECLELHTVSPQSGYTQQDVTAFAAILTGWSIDLQADPPGFRFRPATHEPGVQTVLGRQFPPGEAGGIEALQFLGTHPATYRFLATRLVRHFVADDPPPDVTQRIEMALHETDGDLGHAAAALVRPDGAWQPLTKLRTPQELMIGALRATELPPDQLPDLLGILAGLGQPLWAAPAPNGWPDRAADWAAPEAMVRRIDWAYGLAGRTAATDPLALADATLGPLLQPATREAMRRAGSRRDALTLFLTSPEFQRR